MTKKKDNSETPITIEGLCEFLGSLFIIASTCAGIAFLMGMAIGFGLDVYMKLIGH